jgi:hypothetical protein
MSVVKRAMLVVITAVAGTPCKETCTRAFCTAIAETANMPAIVALVAFGSSPGPAEMQTTSELQKNTNCITSKGRSELRPIASHPPASSLASLCNTAADDVRSQYDEVACDVSGEQSA